MKGTIADLASSGIQAGISAVKNFAESIVDLAEETREYRSMQAKMSGSAEAFGYSLEFAQEKYQEFYSYLADDQMSTNAITNLMGLQVETKNPIRTNGSIYWSMECVRRLDPHRVFD